MQATLEMVEARARAIADSESDGGYYPLAFGEGADERRALDASLVSGHEFTSAENDRAEALAWMLLDDLDEPSPAPQDVPEPEPEPEPSEPSEPVLEGDIDTRICTALLLSKDLKAASERADVSRTTIYKRLKDPEFVARLEAERAAVHDAVRGSVADALTGASIEALTALVSIARGEGCGGWMGLEMPDATDRIKAAHEILDLWAKMEPQV